MNDREDPRTRARMPVRIWRSIFRGPIVPRTDAERRKIVLNTLILHFRPIRVPAATIPYTHTFGLGGTSLVIVGTLMFTGVLLMFGYEPSPERAYASVVSLQDDYLFGRLVRAVHHWSAHLAVVVVTLHLLRVVFTGGFHGPRQFNWVVGVVLLFCVLASNFTGYLLPWDQLSYWAVTICTGMMGYAPGIGPWLQSAIRGGAEVGSGTIITFYALHTTVLPVLLVGLMALHFWRVRKAGGVVIPPRPAGRDDDAERKGTVLFVPHLLLRETALGLAVVALIVVAAVLFEAPLGMPANPGMSPNPAKAPWYFQGFQELQIHLHPAFAVFIIPLAATLALLLIPYLRYDADQAGAWFASPRGKRTAILSAVIAAAVTVAWVLLDEYVFDPAAWFPGLPPILSNGLIPFAVLVAGLAGYTGYLRKHRSTTIAETVQAVFVLLFVSLIVLTAVGVWFRGKGMALAWPWNA